MSDLWETCFIALSRYIEYSCHTAQWKYNCNKWQDTSDFFAE